MTRAVNQWLKALDASRSERLRPLRYFGHM